LSRELCITTGMWTGMVLNTCMDPIVTCQMSRSGELFRARFARIPTTDGVSSSSNSTDWDGI
jgi:hypothetical protein